MRDTEIYNPAVATEGAADGTQAPPSEDANRFPLLKGVIWFRYILAGLVTIVGVSLIVWGLIFLTHDTEGGGPAFIAYSALYGSLDAIVFLGVPSFIIARGLAARRSCVVWLALATDAIILLYTMWSILFLLFMVNQDTLTLIMLAGTSLSYAAPFVIEGVYLIRVFTAWRKSRGAPGSPQ